jgi:ankyrin repeat protein
MRNIPATKKASPSARRMDYRLLFDAAKKGNLEELRRLVEEEGYDPSGWTNSMGSTPVHYACVHGHLDVVKYLVERFGKVSTVDARDMLGVNALHYASNHGFLDIVAYLVEQWGAAVDARADDGWTPLHFACYENHLEVARYLVELWGAKVNAKAADGSTPLHKAICSEHDDRIALVKYLVEDKNAFYEEVKGPSPLNKALSVASGHGKDDVVDYFKELGLQSFETYRW